MPVQKSTLGNRTLHSQGHEIVCNVHGFIKNKDVKKVQKRTSQTNEVSKLSFIRVSKKYKEACEDLNESFSTNGKKHIAPKPVTGIDIFYKCVTRRTVHSFYTQQKSLPIVNNFYQF